MQNRAISMLQIRGVDEGARTFRGWATTPDVDRVGDVINPLGATFEREIPLLHQHKHDAPIGTVRLKKPTKDGIEFEAKIPKINEPPALKERVDVAWSEVVHGLVPAVSIGFKPIEYSFMDTGGIKYEAIEIYELSTVSVPANSSALITAVKSIDQAARKEAGVPDPEIPQRVFDPRVDWHMEAFARTKHNVSGAVMTQELLDQINEIGGNAAAHIQQDDAPAATGKQARVVFLNDPARVRASWVVRRIVHTT